PCVGPPRPDHHHPQPPSPACRQPADEPPDRPAHHSHALRVRVWQRLEELHHRQHIVGFFLHTRHESWPTIFSDRFAKGRAISLTVAAPLRHYHDVTPVRQHLPHINKRPLFSFVPPWRPVVVNHHWKRSRALRLVNVRLNLEFSARIKRSEERRVGKETSSRGSPEN